MFGAWLSLTAEAAVATAATAANTGLLSLSIPMKGLLTTLFGLLGVFLVLLLFFVSIKLMQRIGVKKETQDE
ncbi:MAG: hypothetical protein VB087_00075 [Candidatus Limiplasma sp.]|nr:hypothetical protein [Candidatus Limiplasma sp.]